ncbi:MAG TPA: putative Ig domain-containing protein [Solirubrobacteraceae bacterium]|nr:putative Ig domain-containing protein [Solirubrobacteraceae bacterium]
MLTCVASAVAASGTTTEASVNPSATTAGGSVTYSATVTSEASGPPTGTVTFTSGATTLCTTEALVEGTGSCSATNAPTGSDTVIATYSGDSNFAESSGTTSLTVNEAPVITSANSTTFTEGAAGSFPVTASGFPSPTITETDTLPEGVTFSGGVLSGTPTQTGTFPISFTATNSAGFSVQSFTLTVNSKPAISSASKTTFTEGTAGSFPVTASGFPSPTITATGTLPTGVTFSGGVLSGTPTQGGVYPITFTATNSAGAASQSFTLTVDAAPVITSANKATFAQGVASTFTVTATGTPVPGIVEWGNLPAGVSFTGSALVGTPTQQGTFQITFTASNGVGSPSSQQFLLTVLGLRVTTTSLPGATREQAYSQQLAAAGGTTPYKWKVVGGSLPAGLKLSNAGLISGTVKRTGDSTTVKVEVKDSSKTDPQSALREFVIQVAV